MTKKNIQTLITLGIISASVFVVIMIVLAKGAPANQTQIPPQPTTTITETSTPTVSDTSAVPTATPSTNSRYKDGTYKSSVSYVIPRGNESSISITATIKNDVITAISDTKTAGDEESVQYQEWFEQEYKRAVVGKKIASISLSSVGGASLTTAAFMEALTNVAAKAKN